MLNDGKTFGVHFISFTPEEVIHLHTCIRINCDTESHFRERKIKREIERWREVREREKEKERERKRERERERE